MDNLELTHFKQDQIDALRNRCNLLTAAGYKTMIDFIIDEVNGRPFQVEDGEDTTYEYFEFGNDHLGMNFKVEFVGQWVTDEESNYHEFECSRVECHDLELFIQGDDADLPTELWTEVRDYINSKLIVR